jgi:secondary thiamine-phosphate synthase enzyme
MRQVSGTIALQTARQGLLEITAEDSERYEHGEEGPDDMPAHLRAALTNVQLAIPLLERRLALGTWQGIYLFEHRRSPHRRTLALHLLGA